MIKSDCPIQEAFVKSLYYIFQLRDDVHWRQDDSIEDHYKHELKDFIKKWCPTKPEYKGAQFIEDDNGLD